MATTDPGPIDLAATGNGRYLYVETGGAGIIDEFRIETGGTLVSIGTVGGFGSAGLEGIVAG